MEQVFSLNNTSPLRIALKEEGVENLNDFLSLTSDIIDEFKYTYKDADDTLITAPVPRGHRRIIIVFFDFIRYREHINNPIGNDWINITKEEFDTFRTSTEYLNARQGYGGTAVFSSIPGNTVTPTGSGPIPASTTTKSFSSEELFKRGIKRDQTLFPTLKDEMYHDSWHRTFENQAHAQGVALVLDPDYKPSTPDEIQVFDLMQTFMYAVLEVKVLTSKGKEIVRNHEHTKDAQAAYASLVRHHRTSTAASIAARDIMGYLTSVTIGDGRFKGSTVEFLVHWSQQVKLYQKLMGGSSTFGDNEKLIHLVRAVSPIPELRQIKITADMLSVSTGTSLQFDKYYELLSSAAAQYDAQLKYKPKRMIYSHDVHQEDDDYNSHNEDTYDIDTPVSYIEANVHARSPPPRRPQSSGQKVFMPKERWQLLSDKTKRTWDTIPDKDKSIILGYNPQGEPPTSHQQHVNLHETVADHDDVFHDAIPEFPSDTGDPQTIQAHETQTKPVPKYPPHDIRSILSQKNNQPKPTQRQASMASVTYRVSTTKVKSTQSLIDRGANGGIAGQDVKVIATCDRTVDIQGIDNHQMTNVSIGTVAGLVTTNKGPVVLIMHQYALIGRGHSIHSPGQWEWYKHSICDKSVHVGGLQRIKTTDGYLIPLSIHNGLPRLHMRPPTNSEFDSLPHVVVTNDDNEWDPSVLDFSYEEEDEHWFDAIEDHEEHPYHSLFDEYGNYRRRVLAQLSQTFLRLSADGFDQLVDSCIVHSNSLDNQPFLEAYSHEIDMDSPVHQASLTPRSASTRTPDYSLLRPYFGWISIDNIKKTFQNTTQLARTTTGTLLKRMYRSQNPALNVIRRNEPVATDELYSDTPAIDCGATRCQVFVGMNTDVVDIYPLQTSKQFVNTLEDNVRFRGAPTKLVSDRAQVEISGRALEFLRVYGISSWQSEPHQQHQNYAERKIQQLKQITNTIMDRTGAPPYTWLLCLMYVAFLLNHTWSNNIQSIPLTALLGTTVDISILLRYHFWQKVYFKAIEPGFPSDSKERLGHIVGISEHVGHALTWKILDAETHKVIHRSLCRPAQPDALNLRIDQHGGEQSPQHPFIKSKTFDDSAFGETIQDNSLPENSLSEPESEHNEETTTASESAFVSLNDLVGTTFLMDPEPDGQRFRARVIEMIDQHDNALERNPDRIRFLCKLDQDGREELLTYNQILEHLNRDNENPVVWKYKRIVSHQGPLRPGDKDYNGSIYNVMLEWEGGEITSEPLNMIAKDDPVTCAIYAKDNNLLELEGWKRFKSIARRQKKFVRMAKQAYLRSFRSAPKYKYGYEVAKDWDDAIRLDKKAGNLKWQNAVEIELGQIDDYVTFKDLGHKDKVKPPEGYKRIRVHLVFDVKHDGRFKARLVADGHLTDAPLESVYSGVVSIRGFRITMFLSELNGLELWATDIGNAYLESYTSEKVYIIAGPEFKERKDHILVINKALYGLKSSGQRWHDKLHDCLTDLGWNPCKAEPDIWMKQNGNVWEYVAVYVDDIAIAMKHPNEFIEALTSDPYNFKLKGTGPIQHHLGMQFTRDEDGTLCLEQKKYMDKIIDGYKRHFGSKPKTNVYAPLEKGDHPEMDTSEFLDPEKTKLYQSLIGALQWMVTIGRFDIMTAVVTMSSFRAAPRIGHLERIKRIYGYLSRMDQAKIRVRTEEPDYSGLPNYEYDWSRTVYGAMSEMLPNDAPEPLGKRVTLSHFVDANLMHDLITGRSLTGILHLMNKTPIEWYSKKQATVEVATYGSEMVAMRTCIEQIIDLRNTLRYLGVPVNKKSYVFGDNESVINSGIKIHAKLHKRHNMLSFHFVREAIAAGYITLTHIPGNTNPADILSKHWGYSDVWPIMKPLLFHQGDTMEC